MPSAITVDKTHVPTPPSPNARRASTKILSRNIDNVILGNLKFEAWYYSPYPDNLILGSDHQVPLVAKHLPDIRNGYLSRDSASPATATTQGTLNDSIKAEVPKPSCPTLHVCPYCFRYTPNLREYTTHLHLHLDMENQAIARDGSFEPVPDSATKVYDWEGYTVWDVDGEVEKLYCQNLSLFGKLFLEQKSVFFDTSGFHYFVLTYTAPKAQEVSTPTVATGRGRKRRSGSSIEGKTGSNDLSSRTVVESNLRTQVMGFFSKENLSWDNNNLACILVFPPYQHRNLGQLLMTVSYKLSGWEWEDSIIGGPEKPLSAMGRKSYLRFWSERIARFMMGQSWDADGRVVFESADGRKRKKPSVNLRKEETTVREIGERTGMLSEDVMAALNEMGVCEVVPPKRKKKKISDGNTTSTASTGAVVDRQEITAEADHGISMTVMRRKVLDWAISKGVDLVCPVKEEGFLGEWALSDIESGESRDDHEDSADE